MKNVGEPCAGEPHARFDAAAGGNQRQSADAARRGRLPPTLPRPDPTEVSAFIDAHRDRFGVELICRTIGTSASAYYQRRTGKRSARAVDDARLLGRIRQLHAANYHAYGRGGCGRRCAAPASRSVVTGSRG